jgi:hypothetical protein
VSRLEATICARSCDSWARLTYPWPAYAKVTSTRCRSWQGMAIRINCRRSRREWLRAAYRLYGVPTTPRVFTSLMAKSLCSKAGKFLLPVPVLSLTPLSQQRPATAKSCAYSLTDSGGLTKFRGGPTLGSVCTPGQATYYEACDANITFKSTTPMFCPVGRGNGTYGTISFDPRC